MAVALDSSRGHDCQERSLPHSPPRQAAACTKAERHIDRHKPLWSGVGDMPEEEARPAVKSEPSEPEEEDEEIDDDPLHYERAPVVASSSSRASGGTPSEAGSSRGRAPRSRKAKAPAQASPAKPAGRKGAQDKGAKHLADLLGK